MFGSPALQWSPSNADIITTIAAACLEYGDICISEASGIFLVGVTICICAVECYESTFESPSLLYVGGKG